MAEWKFSDPPNVAVFTVRGIVNGSDWIAYVSHDAEDGSWQFHNSEAGAPNEREAMIVSLQKIVQLDESVVVLADLPEGWRAWRNSQSSPWQRAKSRPVGVNDNE